MYARVRLLANLRDIVDKDNGVARAKQTVFLKINGAEPQKYVERGKPIEDTEEFCKAYRQNQLYFYVPNSARTL